MKQYEPYRLEAVATIDVPSGKLLVANDLRDFFGQDELSEISSGVNLRASEGVVQLTESFAKKGMFFCYIGDCVGFHFENEKLIIETPKDDMSYIYKLEPSLRWFSAIDYDNYLSTMKKLPDDYCVIDLDPGTYCLHGFSEVSIKKPYIAFIEKVS